MNIKQLSKRELVAYLLSLNDISQGKVADLAGIFRQNVSRWFTGHDNALSQDKQLRVLSTLGVSYGTLRSDGIHKWGVREVKDAALVLGNLLNDDDRANCEIWPVNNFRYKFCVILRVVRREQPLWIMIYRPLMSEAPKVIDSESLQFGRDMLDVNIDTATWESWLPPAEIDPIAFNFKMNELISQFPYPAPPKYYSEDAENPTNGNALELSQEELWASLIPTDKELKVWRELLLQAKLKGMKFDDVVSKTRTALEINVWGSKKE